MTYEELQNNLELARLENEELKVTNIELNEKVENLVQELNTLKRYMFGSKRESVFKNTIQTEGKRIKSVKLGLRNQL